MYNVCNDDHCALCCVICLYMGAVDDELCIWVQSVNSALWVIWSLHLCMWTVSCGLWVCNVHCSCEKYMVSNVICACVRPAMGRRAWSASAPSAVTAGAHFCTSAICIGAIGSQPSELHHTQIPCCTFSSANTSAQMECSPFPTFLSP